MAADARGAFAQRFAALLADSGLQTKEAVARVNANRPRDASWSVTVGLVSAWKTGRNLPSEANQVGFFRVVRLLTGHARGRAARSYPVRELLDEAAWTRMLKQARAAPLPDAAEHGEIVMYLKRLVEWMNSDPWPQDRRFNGPVLTPAAIERKLKATAADKKSRRDFDADELVQRCQRLVVLGGPGSGKTWLAKRTVRRCAEGALQALAAGASLDEVELPLYTTCSRLVGTDGDIRQAVVSSALDQLGDLGGSGSRSVLRSFFGERSAPTLLVIDSLDEADDSDDRLRQADTLPWRIILTSRPGSWNNELDMKGNDDTHQVSELKPLRYPDDVEHFIRHWFTWRPDAGRALLEQIAERPSLQEAGTVPLILAFYCIIGGGKPLPERQRDLYAKVLKRMLTGRWRGRGRNMGAADILQTLRSWAWAGAFFDNTSGVGTWEDEIWCEQVCVGDADNEALDHIATPTGPPDADTGRAKRRFVHRTIREHLVAEYIGGLSVNQPSSTPTATAGTTT